MQHALFHDRRDIKNKAQLYLLISFTTVFLPVNIYARKQRIHVKNISAVSYFYAPNIVKKEALPICHRIKWILAVENALLFFI